MKTFSHNRLSYFEQCPARYKYRYIDEIPPVAGQSIETYLGIRVHETLEQLYLHKQLKRTIDFEEIKNYFLKSWDQNWQENIQIINKKKAIDYKQMGLQYVSNYFLSYLPFNQDETIALEKELMLTLDGKEYSIKGIIDRLAKDKEGIYIIHDYKTGKKLPSKDQLNKDRQLGIYALAVQQNFENVESIELIWHYLAYDKEICVKPKQKNLEILENNIIKKIKTIEKADQYPHRKSVLCKWCEYNPICEKFENLA